MAGYAELLSRIDRLAARAESTGADDALLCDIEDALADGYMQALTEEARSRRMASRIERLVDALEEPGAAVEARRLAVQRRTLDHKIGTLRSRLNAIREEFIRLGGMSSAQR